MFKGSGVTAARKGKNMTYAEFLELAKNTVISITFWLSIVLDIWGIGAMIVHFVKWVHGGIKKIRNNDAETKAE